VRAAGAEPIQGLRNLSRQYFRAVCKSDFALRQVLAITTYGRLWFNLSGYNQLSLRQVGDWMMNGLLEIDFQGFS
jgi:hypothetical protein